MGNLVYRGIPFLVTIERPWKSNEPFESCLPPGTYLVERYTSDTYDEDDLAWEVKDVPGRTKMLFHAGNWIRNSKGCTLPGLHFGDIKKEPRVVSSRVALKILADLTESKPFQLIVHSRQSRG